MTIAEKSKVELAHEAGQQHNLREVIKMIEEIEHDAIVGPGRIMCQSILSRLYRMGIKQ
jgi:hypothetical protein